MPSSSGLFADLEHRSPGGGGATLGDERALQLALELSMLGFTEPLTGSLTDPDNTFGLGGLGGANAILAEPELRSKKSQNMTECVPVPSSEHVAEIVGRQGCKIKALRAKTNTYIKTPVRGEEPVFVVTGRKEDVSKAKREILSAAEHFSQIRASRKNNLAGLSSGDNTPPGPPANVPGHITIQVRVPYRVVGLVVGPKGATIKRIQHQTHTYIVTPSRDKEPVFEVTGLPPNVETARREIEAHIALRTGNGSQNSTGTAGLGSPVGGVGGLGLNGGTTPTDAADCLSSILAAGNCLESDAAAELFFTSLYKSGLNSILNYIEPPPSTAVPMGAAGATNNAVNLPSSINSIMSNTNLPNMDSMSGAFSTSSCSSSSSSSSSSSGRADLGAIWSSSERDEGLGDSPSFDSSASTAMSSIWSYPGGTATRPSPPNSTSPADSLLTSSAVNKCLVCSEGKVTHALVPCGHNFFCMECANKVCNEVDPQCPVCASPALQTIRIYSPNP